MSMRGGKDYDPTAYARKRKDAMVSRSPASPTKPNSCFKAQLFWIAASWSGSPSPFSVRTLSDLHSFLSRAMFFAAKARESCPAISCNRLVKVGIPAPSLPLLPLTLLFDLQLTPSSRTAPRNFVKRELPAARPTLWPPRPPPQANPMATPMATATQIATRWSLASPAPT
jgi:hypothetical protein